LLAHYGMTAIHSGPCKPNENGDVEQRHHRFKRAVEQRLILRGSRDFPNREDYEEFLRMLLAELNAGRKERLQREMMQLRRLPRRRLENWPRLEVKVGPHSTISVRYNIYSVHSRLIGERVYVHLRPEQLEVWYGGRRVELLPRLSGRGKHKINYRHIIDWLVRKPGAFERYRYRDALFPTSRFRIAYDLLKEADPLRGHKQYLAILYLAATENETAVDECLRRMIDRQEPISAQAVQAIVKAEPDLSPPRDARVDPVDLDEYDQLYGALIGCGVELEEVVACL